jgi:site-specific DNA recombinase
MPARAKTRSAGSSARRDLAPGAPIFCYVRDSGGVAQEKSTTDQRAELAAYAAARGWQVAGWFEDAARSGADAESRPAFQELIAACRREPPPVAGVLLWSYSRFARDELDAQFYRADLRRRGVEVISVSDSVPDGAFSTVFEALISWKDAQFLADLAENVKRGQRANVLRGYSHGGPAPFGYRAEAVEIGVHRDGKPRIAARWVVDPTTAPQAVRIFEMRAQGYTVEQIREALALPLTKSGLHYVLRNPVYIGTLHYGGEEIAGGVPALIERALWARVQALTTRYARSRTAYLLSGLLFCGACGGPMYGMRTTTKGREYRYYICWQSRQKPRTCTAPRIRADEADRIAMRLVADRWLAPRQVWALLQQALETRDDGALAAEAVRLAGDAERLRSAVARLLDLAEEGDDVRERLRQRRGELAQVTGQLAAVQRQAHGGQISYGEVEAFCAYLREELVAEDVPRARRVVRLVAERFVWQVQRIEAVWRDGVL